MIPTRLLKPLHLFSLCLLYLLSGAAAAPEQNHDCEKQVNQPSNAIESTEGKAADTPNLSSASTQGHDTGSSIATESHLETPGNNSSPAQPQTGATIVANEGHLYPQPNIQTPPENQRSIPELMRTAYNLGMFDSITNEDVLRTMGLPGVRRSEQGQASNDGRNTSTANDGPERDAVREDNGPEGNISSERQPETSTTTSSPASIAATLLPTADQEDLANMTQDNTFSNSRPYIYFQVSS